MRRAVFFDLDGTLLPLDMDEFLRLYYAAVKQSGFYGRISEENGGNIFNAAVYAMLRNDGKALNSDVFFKTIENMSGIDEQALMPYLNSFYKNEFKQVRNCARPDERVPVIIDELRKKGYRLIIATNPLFPKIATDERIRWAGLKPDDFEYVSYYDNSRWCKPNLEFYKEILDKRGLEASECFMIGNDVTEDMGAVELGFKGFLVLNNLIGDIERVPECERGDYSGLLDFVRSLPTLERSFI